MLRILSSDEGCDCVPPLPGDEAADPSDRSDTMLRALRRTLSGLTLLDRKQSEGRLTAIEQRPVSSTDQ